MSVLAAEAGTGAVEAEGAEASAASRSTTAMPRRGGRTQQGARMKPRTGGRTQQGQVRTPPGTRPVVRAAVKASPGRIAASRVQSSTERRVKARGQRAAAQGARKLTGNYHGVVFGEFVLAVLLVAAIPFSKPNRTGVSPYAGRDMIQLLAITVLYFLLAVLAATGRTQARFAAWFGGLILLAVGLAEAASIASAVSSWFGTPAPAATAQPAGNASVVNPGSESPTGSSRPSAQDPGTGLN